MTLAAIEGAIFVLCVGSILDHELKQDTTIMKKLLNVVTSTLNATLNPKPFKGRSLSNVLFDEGQSRSPMCFLAKDNQCFALNASIIIFCTTKP
jgi:hypothetical protein